MVYLIYFQFIINVPSAYKDLTFSHSYVQEIIWWCIILLLIKMMFLSNLWYISCMNFFHPPFNPHVDIVGVALF
jgi:hypothetical protein